MQHLEKNYRKKGVSIYLAVIILSVLLAMILGLDAILVGQITTVRQIGYSAVAFYAADAGIENALYNIKKNNNIVNIGSTPFGSASYSVEIKPHGVDGCDAGSADYVCVKSTGTYKGTIRIIEITTRKPGFSCRQEVAYEGKTYATIDIGPEGSKQCWFAENLNVGTRIDKINDMSPGAGIEKYCFDDIDSNCDNYGGLYQWDEMMNYNNASGSQGICPPDWHIPTDQEWTTLEQYLKDSLPCNPDRNDINSYQCNKAGKKLKVGGITGFLALLGGVREPNSNNWGKDSITSYYSSNEDGGSCEGCRHIRVDREGIARESCNKKYGFSVRCVYKDLF